MWIMKICLTELMGLS